MPRSKIEITVVVEHDEGISDDALFQLAEDGYEKLLAGKPLQERTTIGGGSVPTVEIVELYTICVSG